jgi:Predicted integral membrane protein (DUF2269)
VVVGTSSGHPALYDTLVALHVVCAVIGFGSVALSGLYGATASHPDRPGSAEEAGRYFRSPGRAEWLVLAVPFLGAGALGLRPSGADFGDAWVIAASLIWLAAAGVLLGVVRPAERRLRARSRAEDAASTSADLAPRTGAGAAESRAGPAPDGPGAGRALMWGALACDVLFVAALVLMVGQPA